MRKHYAIMFLFLFVFPMVSGCLDDLNTDEIPDREFVIQDGDNINSTCGCFFIIKPVKGPAVDPRWSVFYLGEKGHSPHQLDFEVRKYDHNGKPSGGDLNASYSYTEDGNDLWNNGEYIGFDMPQGSRSLDIKEGMVFEVLLRIGIPRTHHCLVGSFIYSV